MNIKNKFERGQITILMVFAIIALFGAATLAIDGGMLYLQRRAIQSAVDNAAMTGALAITKEYDSTQIETIVMEAIDRNGFDPSSDDVVVQVNYPPQAPKLYEGNPDFIHVTIATNVPTAFLHFVYQAPVNIMVEAVARAGLSSSGGEYALFAASESCERTIDWSGSTTNVNGGVHSNNDIYVGGSSNTVEGITTYVTSIFAPADKISFIPPPPGNPRLSTVQDYPVDFDMSDFVPGGKIAQAAESAGEYYSCNCKMDMGWLLSNGLYDDATKQLKEGIYFSEQEIDLSPSDIRSNAVTFVSRGKISLGGSSHNIRPYVDGLLIFTDKKHSGSDQCNVGVVNMSGSTQSWNGIVFAPNGLIEFAGSSNTTLHGTLIGFTITLNGSVLDIIYDPDIMPPPPQIVELVQ